ncbi:MAG TPA: hypothetical protein PKM65_16745 [Spirochaetota bacterium]|nr:hypothetical protein [Spirochaetota bacterium]HNT12116.1 hypothetical protein [Spirochaetota bacterium]HOS40740.1 hypothetical protein [Spirochaetota bacterium]HPU90266.1 hypothetical protein [Spirochaetota bacterium]
MNAIFNYTGNGACPLCRRQSECDIHRRILAAIEKFEDPSGHGMEMVVYRCPHFED